MLSSSTETSVSARQSVPPSKAPADSSLALRAELDTLNESLRELKSTDHGVRAYVEMWISFVALAASGKLTYDWQRTHAKPPILAIPLILLGLGVLADCLSHKRRQSKLQREEETKLQRQRELRGLLGLDEAEFPETATASVT